MTRFAVVGMGRSGSTYLVHLLNSHPQILCLGEYVSQNHYYGSQENRDIGEFLEGYYAGASVAGFKMPWAPMLRYPEVWGMFRERDYRLILLSRRNKLDHFLSVRLAQLNDEWSSMERYSEQQIELDLPQLLSFFQSAHWTENTIRKMCQRFPHIEVVYEDLVRGQGLDQMQHFLGVDEGDLVPGTIRARSLPRRQSIANFSAVRQQLTGTPFESFLDESEILS